MIESSLGQEQNVIHGQHENIAMQKSGFCLIVQ